jgi:hypothetical protein
MLDVRRERQRIHPLLHRVQLDPARRVLDGRARVVFDVSVDSRDAGGPDPTPDRDPSPSRRTTSEAVRWMQLACDGDAKAGCSGYAALVDEGRGDVG